MTDIVIAGALRTAIGKFGGTLARTPAPELGATVIRALLEKSGVKPEAISEVIMGQVLAAGSGQNPARQSSIRAGLPHAIPAMTINKVCGSGLKAVMLAAQAIRCGDADIVVAGGQENMSASPHVLPGSRDGFRMGDAKLVDTMIVDGLWDVYNQYHMGTTAENVAKKYEISRARAGRVCRREPEQGGGRAEGRTIQRRDRAGDDRRSAKAIPSRSRRTSFPRRARRSIRSRASGPRSRRKARSRPPTHPD